jgi:ATP adenylyltransferase
MKRLWAPWRNPYIKGIQKQEDCFFCAMVKEVEDEKNLILFRGKHVFVVLNKFPYTNGHLMVVPYLHVASLTNLPKEALMELIETTREAIEWLKKAMNPQGFNVGMNLGKVAGAGLEDHLHMHIVPRWTGDSNFMSTLSETRVISESLADSFQSLKKAIEQGVEK